MLDMSFLNCIVDNPLLSSKQKQDIIKKYGDVLREYELSHGEGNANAAKAAAQAFVSREVNRLSQKKKNKLKDIHKFKTDVHPKQKLMEEKIAEIKDRSGVFGKVFYGEPAFHAVANRLEAIYTRIMSTEREYIIMAGKAFDSLSSKWGGLVQDHETMKAVYREMLGKSTGNQAARDFASAFRQVFDAMHSRYKIAGGIIGKIDNWTPQAHNPYLVGKVSFSEWADFIVPRIDLQKMVDPETGLPMTSAKLNELLPEIYEAIRTNGLSELAERVEAGKQTGNVRGKSMAERRSYSRFFYFRDADTFLEYNARFGYGDTGLFDAIMGHISSMSRDITLLESLGPNPEAMFNRLKLRAESKGVGGTGLGALQSMYNVLAGKTAFNGEMGVGYRVLENLQHWLRSTLLGSAPLSAIPDQFFGASAAKYNGIPAIKFVGEYYRYLNPANAEDRTVLRQQGVISQAVMGNSIRHAMAADDAGGKNFFAFLAGFTNRASGLGIMTDAARTAASMSAAGHMSSLSLSGVRFSDVDPFMSQAFEKWGISEADYDFMMRVRGQDIMDEGATFLLPEHIAAAGNVELSRKYSDWLTDISLMASNEPRLMTRAIMTAGAKKGTLTRATIGSVMMFKSFGVTVTINHLIPSLRHAADPMNGGLSRFGRVGSLMVFMPVLGFMSMQAKQLVAGKEPQDLNAKTMKAAFLQSGGFGILGDFFFSDYSRFNHSAMATLAGPVAGFGNDVLKLFIGNFDRMLAEGEESKFFADAFMFAKRNIPAVKLWYTRLFMERFMLDHMERAVDPNFDKRVRRLEKKMKKETGNEFWWRPGDFSP